MKNKKGFTLVELLVVITLVISILSISIVSSVKISERKKEEAYNEVVKEIETAASQYFNSREYLFEGIEGETYGEITLQKLVNEDYLNKVTDPRTGKSINLCNYVKIKRTSDGIIKASYERKDNDRKSCPDSNKSIIYQYGGPKIELDISGTLGKNNWYVSEVMVTAKADEQKNGKITKFTKLINNTQTNLKTDELKDTSSFNNETAIVVYEVSNEYGKIARAETQVNVDTIAPTISAGSSNENWTNKIQNYWFYDETDNLSGIDYDSIVGYANRMGLTDNEAEQQKYKWNKDKENYFEGHNSNENMMLSLNSGTKNKLSDEGSRRIRYKICDKAGNCAFSNEVKIRYDKTAPKITANSSSENWTNNEQTFWYSNEKDNLSGIDYNSIVGYANRIGLTDNEAEQQKYKWNKDKESYLDGHNSNGDMTLSLNSGDKNIVNSEGSRRIRYKICDKAGNCAFSNEAKIRYDKTAPTIVDSGTGHVACTNVNNKLLSHGFSVQYEDNLTKVHVSFQYYSCGENWSGVINSTTSADNKRYIQTDFSGCKSKNSGMYYILTDEAGNKSEVTLTDPGYNYTINSKGKCENNKWYTNYQ